MNAKPTLVEQQWQFEPHNGFGTNDPDGEPWPFGYISTAPTPVPIFELNVVLQLDAGQLADAARLAAAAPEMLAALIWAASMAEEAIALRRASDDPEDRSVLGLHEQSLLEARAAISKALGTDKTGDA